MAKIIELIQKLIEIKKNDPGLTSDVFQDACREFCNEAEEASEENLLKAKELLDEDITKYIEDMTAHLSWKDFQNKYGRLLFSKKS